MVDTYIIYHFLVGRAWAMNAAEFQLKSLHTDDPTR